MPKMTEEKNRIWLASSSSERLLWLAATLAKLGVSSEVLLRAIASPVKEPADLPAEVITLEYKVLPLAVVLRLIDVTDELVRKLPWVSEITTFDQALAADTDKHLVAAGDVRTFVYLNSPTKIRNWSPNKLMNLTEEEWVELLKLERDMEGIENQVQRSELIKYDQSEHTELYLRRKGIAVRFSLALVAWDAQAGYRIEKCEIIAKLKPGIITLKDIEQAYADGTALKSGARLDLARMIAENDIAETVYVQTASEWRELTKTEIVEIVPAWVKGGVADLATMQRLLRIDPGSLPNRPNQVTHPQPQEHDTAVAIEAYATRITVRTYSFGATAKTFLQLPATVVSLGSKKQEVPASIIEIEQHQDGSYTIEQDGLLVLQYHLNALGLLRSEMVKQTKLIFEDHDVSVRHK